MWVPEKLFDDRWNSLLSDGSKPLPERTNVDQVISRHMASLVHYATTDLSRETMDSNSEVTGA